MRLKKDTKSLKYFREIGIWIHEIASKRRRIIVYIFNLAKDNWLVIFVLCILTCNILIIIFITSSIIKEILVSLISIIIGMLGISVVDFRRHIKEKKKIMEIQNEVIYRFNRYFDGNENFKLTRTNLNELVDEKDILRHALKNKLNGDIEEQRINSIMLCYYCIKWDETKSPEDFQQIQKQSNNLGLKYGEITLDMHNFLIDYSSYVLGQTGDIDDNEILMLFVERHYKDLQFYEIKEELHQSKNLHETLVRIIQLGRLSTFGINQDTLNRLRRDLESSNFKQNTYLILANKIPDRLKDYLRSLPGLSGFPPSVRNVEEIQGKFSGYIVRPSEANSPNEFLEILKRKVGRTDEPYIIRIITLDFLNSLVYTIPEDQSFTTEGLQACYNALEWFRKGYVMDDTVLWNEIAKSTIKPDELLSLIPFNIFCRGIIPKEQSFLIQHYNDIKDYFNIEGLGEWRNIDAELLTDKILTYGEPEYSEDEEINILKLSENTIRVDAIRSRILNLCTAIIEGASRFHMSVQYQA